MSFRRYILGLIAAVVLASGVQAQAPNQGTPTYGSLVVGAPAGGNMGPGSINVTASYANGSPIRAGDPVVSTLDVTGGLAVYGDASTFDQSVCYSNAVATGCKVGANLTNQTGNVLTVDVLPPFIAATGVAVTGTNVLASTTVSSFTGSAGGPGTVTLNNTPSGGVAALFFSPPSNVITFNNSGRFTGTIGITRGSVTVTLGSGWCKSNYSGSQISIPGAGPAGSPLNTRVTTCSGSQAGAGASIFGIEDQAATTISASATMTYGANFSSTCGNGGFAKTGVSGCPGMGILAGTWLGAGGKGVAATPMAITAVYAPNVIGVSVSGTQTLSTDVEHFVVGHDDSAAINGTCALGKASHIRILSVPADHYVPTLSRLCYDFLLRGTGRLIVSDGLRPFVVAGGTPPPADPIVVPWSAPAPTPPRKAVFANAHLRLFRTSLTPQIASTYDSLSAPEPNLVNGLGTYPFALLQAVKTQNPGLGPTIVYPGTSGGTLPNVMDSIAPVTVPPCITNTTQQWSVQMAANCPALLFTIGGATNDDAGMDPFHILNIVGKLQGVGAVFPSPRDLIFYTNHPRTRINDGPISSSPTEDGAEIGAGILCSFAKVWGYPCIDGFAEGVKHIWGYDPLAMTMRRAYDLPYNTLSTGFPIQYTRITHGLGITLGTAGTFGAPFWANMTGAPATDPRGPFIALRHASTSVIWGNSSIKLFYQTSDSTVALECDLGDLLPGVACDDPATGKPPVTIANLLGSVALANSGVGGIAVVTLSGGATFQNCVVGAVVTVPTAGATVTPPGSTAYNAPHIDTVKSCDSTTQITLNLAAANPISYTGFVFWGTPLITSGAVVDAGDGSSNEKIHIEVVGDDLLAWIGKPANQLYAGKIWRTRARFIPLFLSGGNRPAITVWGDNFSGGTTFTTAQPVPNLTDFIDDEVVGSSSAAPVTNTAFLGTDPGDGYAHNSAHYGREVILPLYAAQDFAVGNGGVSVSVTSGAAYTVANCLVGKVLVNDVTAPTITLPPTCANSIEVVDIGGQAAAHNITIAAPSGTTLNGTATITTNFGRRIVTYGGMAAVSQ